MRASLLFLVLVSGTVLSNVSVAQRQGEKPTNSVANLLLTTAISNEKSCRPDRLNLELILSFKNAGSVPVILDKRSFIGHIYVSRTIQQARAKKYAQQARADLYDGAYFAVDPSDMSNFVIIKPGQSYDLVSGQTRVTLLIDQAGSKAEDSLAAGTYFLEIELATWTYFADDKQFRSKWNSQGYLWSKVLKSQPMTFTVDPERKLPGCR